MIEVWGRVVLYNSEGLVDERSRDGIFRYEEVLVVKIMKEVGSVWMHWVESKNCDLVC